MPAHDGLTDFGKEVVREKEYGKDLRKRMSPG
jgi:hypothetical protein